MLGKLMKHEFRATGRIMLPLYLIVLLTSVGANVSLRLLEGSDSNFLNLLGGLLMLAFVVAIFAVCIMSLVVMVNRFRTNLMGDEGYVMFTLPASVHQHVWSKLIVSVIWFAATVLVVALAFFIMFYQVGMIKMFFGGLGDLFYEVFRSRYWGDAVLFCLEFLLLCCVGAGAMCLEFYAAMAVGHSFAGHKVLLSVAAYVGFSFLSQVVGGMGIVLLDDSWLHNLLLGSLGNISGVTAMHLSMVALMVGSALYGAVFYVITTVMLHRHLNLE